MSIAQNKITFQPDDPAPDPEQPKPTPRDPLEEAEALLARFAAGGWLLKRGGGGNGTQADNRAVLDAAVMIALAYEVRASAEMIEKVLSRIAAKEQTL